MELTFASAGTALSLLGGLVGGLMLIWAALRSGWRWGALASPFLAGTVAYATGFRISFVAAPESGFIYLGHLSLPLTVLWIVAVTLSLRFLRANGDERLPLRVGLIAAGAFLAINLIQMGFQSPEARAALRLALALDLGFMAVLIGALVRRKRLPAECLGFVLALISIAGLMKTPTALALLSPLLVLGAPLMTTSLSIAHGFAPALPLPRPRLRRAVLGTYLLFGWLSVVTVVLAHVTRLETFLVLGGLTLAGVLLWREADRALEAGAYVANGKIVLLKVPLTPLRLVEVAERLETAIQTGRKALVMTPDTTALMRAQSDPELRSAYLQADLVTPDGVGLVWGARFLGFSVPERVTGIDLVEELCRRAACQGFKVFLLGGRPGVAAEAKRRLERRFPGIRVVGTHHGYFAEDSQILEEINAREPDLLLVGLGVPRQELWIARNAAKLNAKVIIGVGGSLDVLAGRVRRAPRLWQKLGLEWLYRVLRQPRRLPRALAIPRFLLWLGFLKIAQLAMASSGVRSTMSSSSS